jgi:hypothetical protein
MARFQENINDIGGNLAEAIHRQAEAKHKLLTVRKDLLLPPEAISEAARTYRNSERSVYEIVNHQLDAYLAMFNYVDNVNESLDSPYRA